jgi:hypothetical protein
VCVLLLLMPLTWSTASFASSCAAASTIFACCD